MPAIRARMLVPMLLAGASIAALLALLAGCTSTTNGVGSLRAPISSGPSTAQSPSGSTQVNPGGPNSPAPNTGSPRPPGCSADGCQLRLSASLASPYGVAVWADDLTHSAILALTNGGPVPVSSRVLANESPAQLSCISAGQRSNCVLIDLTGTHSSVARLVRENNGGLVLGSPVQGATPTMQALDLNQDGWVDVAGLQNNFIPNYATGQVYWQTWISDGSQLRSTGCGARSHNAGTAPRAPLSGTCP